MMRTGIDVSWHQNEINWQAVKDAGHEWMMARTTNGKTYDTSFQQHFDTASAAGLVTGGYHYLRVGWGVQTQMDSILEVLDGRKPAFYDLDVERFHNDAYSGPDVRDRTYWMLRALEDNLDCPILVYCNQSYFGTKVGDRIMIRDYTGQPKPRANYWRLHVASWGFNNGEPYPEGPFIPKGWRADDDGDGEFKDTWDIWQYTSKGIIPNAGGSANLDLNQMQDSFWDLLVPDEQPPPPPPDDLDLRVFELEKWRAKTKAHADLFPA